MSYQFEDDSAMDELLSQQLDRHKKQQPSSGPRSIQTAASRPTTGQSLNQPRASTATADLAASRRLAAASQTAAADKELFGLPTTSLQDEVAPSRGKLSSWLERDSSRQTRRESAGAESETTMPLYRARKAQAAPSSQQGAATTDGRPPAGANLDELDRMLTDSSLQDMSKQRLVQLILEQLQPVLQDLRQFAGKNSPVELERLANELQAERNRYELAELRHEEQLKLAEQKWAQINQQLETRLERSELEFAGMMASQREHLARLDEQYQSNLARTSDNYGQRMRDEQARLAEILKQRDELHKLELDSKLNVNFDLAKLHSIQTEWRRALEVTIEQLNDQFKSIESLLDKQAHQVNGTNSELIKRTRQLCEQYDKFEESNGSLKSLATNLNEMMPKFLTSQAEGELVLRKTGSQLAEFGEMVAAVQRREQEVERARLELEQLRQQLQAETMQLKVDANRVALKEDRLDELIKTNSERETNLNEQRHRQLEEQAHLHTKRVHLEEKSNELKEQNYSLHLMRKRLTRQREELIKSRTELEREQKALQVQGTQANDESNKIAALRVRAKREMDQLRRLQHSLVCSLCMSRLFDGGGGSSNYNDNNNNNNTNQLVEPADELLLGAAINRPGDLSASLGRLIAAAKTGPASTANDVGDLHATFNEQRQQQQRRQVDVLLRQQQRQVERDTSLMAAESKYVELLSNAN